MIFHKISVFLPGLLCFSSKSLYPESITAAMFTPYENFKGFSWMLTQACRISHASKISHFNVLNQSHFLLSTNDVPQLMPYIFKRQT